MRSSSMSNSRLAPSFLFRTVSRWVLGTVGILWVAIAASLCGCSPISPVNGWAMNESGKAFYRRGDYRSARYEFERALMDSPRNADYAYNVAAAMDREGDHLAAEKMYRHAMTLDPGHQPAYHGLAAMMIEDGRTTEANDLVNTWAATQPYSPEAATELGWLKGEQGDFDGADRELRRALSQNPRHSRARKELARLYGKTGRNGEASAEYARSLFMEPNQPETRAEMAALGNSVYGDPALQMAATMPLYDPTLQASPYPAFTAPTTQPPLASNFSNPAGWYSPTVPTLAGDVSSANSGQMIQPQPMNGAPAYMSQAPTPQMMPYSQASWGQSPPALNQPTYTAPQYPGIVTTPYVPHQNYSTARPNMSFFQPQQSYNGSMPQGGMTPTPTLVPEPDNQISYGGAVPMNGNVIPAANDAPAWNGDMSTPPTMLPAGNWSTPPTMNASYGSPTPVPQISAVPVVPAF